LDAAVGLQAVRGAPDCPHPAAGSAVLARKTGCASTDDGHSPAPTSTGSSGRSRRLPVIRESASELLLHVDFSLPVECGILRT